MRYIITLSGLLFLFSGALAQVQVSLQQPPPFKFKVEDLWKVTIINPGAPVNVYLMGVVENSNGKRLADAKTVNFSLITGTMRVNANMLGPIDINKYDDDVEKTLNATGTLQSGSYRCCVYVYSASSNQVLGSDCQSFEIMNVSQPVLLQPLNKQSVSRDPVIFNWLPPVPVPIGKNITYTLSIFEISARQTAYYSVLSEPAYFKQDRLQSAIFQYPYAARQFQNNKKYAWQVKVYVNGTYICESETWEFFYSNSVTSFSDSSSSPVNKKNLIKETKLNNTIQPDISSNILNTGAVNYGIKDIDEFKNLSFKKNSLFQKLPGELSETKSFQVNGNYFLNSGFSNRQATGSEVPKNYLSALFDPSVSIYGIPLSFKFYLDTKQRDLSQNLNSWSLELNSSKLNENVNRNSEEDKKSNENTLINKEQKSENISRVYEANKSNGFLKFLTNFKSLTIGDVYPFYTPYTLNSTKVTGIDLEFNPGLFYLAFSGLNNLDEIDNINFKRKIFAGRIGIGPKEFSHFYFTMLKAWDDENSMNLDNITSGIKPQENLLFGTEGTLKLFKGMFEVGGEGAASMITRDKTSSDLNPDDMPGFLKDLMNPKMSSSFDYMFSFNSSLNIPSTLTRFSGGYKYIGPGYTSLGAQNIRNDLMALNFKLDQFLFNSRLQFTASLDRENDNLLSVNRYTNVYYRWGFNLRLNFLNLPYLSIDFRPNVVSNDASNDSLKVDNRINILYIIARYPWNMQKYSLNTTVSFISQTNNTYGVANNNNIITASLSEDINFRSPLSIRTSICYNRNEAYTVLKSYIYDLAVSYLFFNIWNNSLGVNYSLETDQNKKLGFFYNTSFPMWKFADLYLGLQYNIYRENIFTYGDYNETIANLTLSKSW